MTNLDWPCSQHSHKYLADFNSGFSPFTTCLWRFRSVSALGVLCLSLDSSRKLIKMSGSGDRKGFLLLGISCLFFFFYHSAISQFLGCGSATRTEITFIAVNTKTLHRMHFPKEMEKPLSEETPCLVIREERGSISGFPVFRSGIRASPCSGGKRRGELN